jgi:hypothetical protein
MAKKRAVSVQAQPDRWFVKELSGENPPSFSALQTLYELASDLYGLRPWRLLDESELILVRDRASGEICYCSVMGALGEVLAMQAYIGAQGYRQFRRLADEEITDPGEFFASQHSVSVEFVPRAELDGEDRKLLSALGHPVGKGLASPIFRTIRPGFHPWFVTQEEAETLAECIRAVIAVCCAVAEEANVSFWDKPETYPMVTPVEEDEHQYQIRSMKPVVPGEPPVILSQLNEESIRQLRGQDYAVRGVMELDRLFSPAVVGKKNERKACVCLALAVDADSGMVYPPELTTSSVAAGDAMAKACIKAIQTSRIMPRKIHVRSRGLKESLAPLSMLLGVPIGVAGELRAMDEAQSHLLRMLAGEPAF